MSYIVNKCDICNAEVDIIVNASNGIGYMGGFIGKYIRLNGVAESIHYLSKGTVEKEAKRICRSTKYKQGDIFTTSSGKLKAKHIIHAVTVNYPGEKSDIEVIRILVPKIISKAHELKAKSIALPLLGTGVGKVSKYEVLKIYDYLLRDIDNLDIIICMK